MVRMYSLVPRTIALPREPFRTSDMIRDLPGREGTTVVGVDGIVATDGGAVFGRHVIVDELFQFSTWSVS